MDFLEPLAAVGFVMALLGGALVLLKKRGMASFHGGSSRQMVAIERLNLGPHHALHLVRMGGRSVVVATAPSSVQVLGEVEDSFRAATVKEW